MSLIVIYEALTLVLLKIQVFLDITQCCWVNCYSSFNHSSWLHIWEQAVQDTLWIAGP